MSGGTESSSARGDRMAGIVFLAGTAARTLEDDRLDLPKGSSVLTVDRCLAANPPEDRRPDMTERTAEVERNTI